MLERRRSNFAQKERKDGWAHRPGLLAVVRPVLSASSSLQLILRCVGISYISSSDYLLVSLSSGSFHLISLSPIALLLDSDSARFTNSGRSLFEVVLARRKQQRDRFHPEGKGSISRKEGAKVLGFVGLGGGKGGVDVAYIFE